MECTTEHTEEDVFKYLAGHHQRCEIYQEMLDNDVSFTMPEGIEKYICEYLDFHVRFDIRSSSKKTQEDKNFIQYLKEEGFNPRRVVKQHTLNGYPSNSIWIIGFKERYKV